MESLNRIELRGVAGRVDITEVGGSKLVRFSVATNHAYRGRDNEPIIETTWHNVSAWDKGLELKKGDAVEVSGRVRMQRYTDANGVEQCHYDVVANDVRVLGEPSL